MDERRTQENTVRIFTIGNTKIRICEDHCQNKSAQELCAALKRIASKALEERRASTNGISMD